MTNFSDDALIQEFVVESREHLSSIEPDLLILEREGQSAGQEIINRIFRAIHSIKGASGFFGFENLKKMSHVMESVLMLIRDGSMNPSSEVMDPLLAGVDKLNSMLEDIQQSEAVACQEVISALEETMGKKSELQKQAVPVSPTPESASKADSGFPEQFFQPDRLSLEDAVKHGKRLFSIQVDLDKDLTSKNRNPLNLLDQLSTVGTLLDSMMDLSGASELTDCLESSLSVLFLFASVLEPDLVAMAVDIPENQVQLLQKEDILAKLDALADAPQQTAPPTPKQEPLKAVEPPKPTVTESESKPVAVQEAPKSTPAPAPVATKSSGSEGNETIRVRVDLLNKLMDLAGEMVLSRNQLLRGLSNDTSHGNVLSNIVQNIDLITSDLQEHIMQTRMQPVGSIFGKFPRVVRDIARTLGKEIDLQMSGEDVELDKTILESLSDPLTHLIRNCCDHAIETPEDRASQGKPRAGVILLKAYHEGGQINIAITDDGHGIDPVKVTQKAVSNGAIQEADVRRMSPQEMLNLIFLPGLSTAEKVSEISGRGVGMDVVKTNIEKIGGHISIESELGQGTTILLRLPLTLAIIPSLIVGVGEQRFAVPQVNLVELVRVKASEVSSRIEKISSAAVLRLRGKLLPLIRLADVLGMERTYFNPKTGQFQGDRRQEIVDNSETGNRRQDLASDYNILVLKVGVNQFGLIVEELFDTEEIVVKPLSSYLKDCKCFTGATIMGDGSVAMILDAGGILNYTKLSFSDLAAEEKRRESEVSFSAKSNGNYKQSVILFNHSINEIFALPLESVIRLEKFNPADVERISGRHFLTYNDKSLLLIYLSDFLSVEPCPTDLKEGFLIIPKAGDGAVGIVASKILDTLEIQVAVEKELFKQGGIRGTSIVNGHLTLFLDPKELIAQAGINHKELAHVQ